MDGDDDDRITTLVEWATRHGASLHPSVQVYDDPTTGLSFRVDPSSPSPLAAWERVVSLPTKLSLSYLDAVSSPAAGGSGGGPAFHPEILSRTRPHVVGRLFLAKQRLLGPSSFWWPYIRALPRPDDPDSWALPPFWPDDDAELLEGTNVEVGLDKIRADVRAEYAAASELLRAHGDEHDRAIDARLYRWAYCIFSSRSFRPSLVLSDADRASLPDGVGIDDFSVLLPLFDIGNHDMTVDVRWELRQGHDDDGDGGDDPERQTAGFGISSSSSSRSSCCELRVGRAFEPGQQVFNNYSIKSNAELLLGYGFMVPASEDLHNDYIHVRKRASSPRASDEYHISRRPLDHPSSLLGRHRAGTAVRLDGGRPMVGAFRHVQPDMVWDIFCTLLRSSGGEQQQHPAGGEQEEQRRRLFSGDVEPGSAAHTMLEHTVAIIQHKVMQELERLDETDVEVAQGDEEALTRNQRLALDYRQRCRVVLESTLETMGTGMEEQEEQGR